MKFDFAIGNPAYNESFSDDGNETYAPPVYHKFIDAACEIAEKVEMVHPARFLFNAGSTPKAWNEKMLSDPHFKVVEYEADAKKLFPSTSINGGIAITYHDASKNFGAIEVFCENPEMNSILRKVLETPGFSSMEGIVVTSYAYHFTDVMHNEHPTIIEKMSKGHSFDLKSNVLEKLDEVFHEKPMDDFDCVRIIGRIGSSRDYRFIKRKYIEPVINLDKYKVYASAADGAAGQIGAPIPARILGKPAIGYPKDGFTESFFSIGTLDSKEEAEALLKYVKTQFSRTLLGVLKVTKHITPGKWKYVPIQDFTSKSDINWNTSIKKIDQQLYKKYNLTDEEIEFIEKHVKEME